MGAGSSGTNPTLSAIRLRSRRAGSSLGASFGETAPPSRARGWSRWSSERSERLRQRSHPLRHPFAKRSLRPALRSAMRGGGSRLRMAGRVRKRVTRRRAKSAGSAQARNFAFCVPAVAFGRIPTFLRRSEAGSRVAPPRPCPRLGASSNILRSVNNPERRYIGLTSDPRSRLTAHNEGLNASTTRWRPWSIDICIELRTESMALRFEKYLESGSGHAFANLDFREAGS